MGGWGRRITSSRTAIATQEDPLSIIMIMTIINIYIYIKLKLCIPSMGTMDKEHKEGLTGSILSKARPHREGNLERKEHSDSLNNKSYEDKIIRKCTFGKQNDIIEYVGYQSQIKE